MTFEGALSHLLGWMGEDVRLVITPRDSAVHVAGMSGKLRLGQSLPTAAQSLLGSVQADDVMILHVGAAEDPETYSYFVIAKDEFGTAWTAADTTDGAEILHVLLKGAAISVRPTAS